VLTLLLAACSVDDGRRAPPEPLGEVEEEFSSAVQERTVPLRVVQIVNSASDPDVISYATLQSGVQAANEVFKAAGVQYWIKSYERWVSPQFSDLSVASNPSKTWTQVRSDLQVVFPGMPSNAWTDGTP